MDDNGLRFLLQQLAYRMPTVLACAFGFVLALIYLRNCPRPAILTMLATGVMAVASVATALVQAYLVRQMQMDHGAGQGRESYAHWMGIVGAMGTVVYAVALVLLLIAVFIGRRSTDS